MDDQLPTGQPAKPAADPNAVSIPVNVSSQPKPEPSTAPALPGDPIPTVKNESVPVTPEAKPSAPIFSDGGIKTDFETTPISNTAADMPPSSGKSLAELMAAEEAKKPMADPQSALHPQKKHGKGLKIIIALLLVLSLVGGAAFAYVQTNGKVKEADTNTAPVAQPEQAATDESDPDAAAKDLDATLDKVDDDKEYNTEDLSDTSLGL